MTQSDQGIDERSFQAAVDQALAALAAGRWAAARELAAGLMAAAPARPHGAFLGARAALGLGELSAARGLLESLAGRADLSAEQAAEVWLRLSEALDGLGEPAAAFRAAAEGKDLQRRAFARIAAQREDAIARFRRLAAWFHDADPARWRAPAAGPAPARAHVFLVGFPRSGTTLLEQALAGHPEVCALEEAPTLAGAHAAFLGSAGGLDRLARLTAEEAARWREAYWGVVRQAGIDPHGKLFVDKAPAATEDLPLVAKLFPQARILFALRDPRDVVLSCFRQDFRLNALTYAFTSLQTAAAAYAACMELADVYRERLPLQVLEVRHEALLDDFAAGLEHICGHIGLKLDLRMLDVAATARSRTVLTPSAPQVRAGLNRRGIGRWRAYAGELEPVMPVLEPWIRRFGYA